MEDLKIIKASGDQVDFVWSKLKRSLHNAGASNRLIEDITPLIEEKLYDGITTKKIYHIAFNLLKKYKHKPVAARYNLKRAIMSLGPEGYVFEKFIGRFFSQKGYSVQTGQVCEGLCIKHEIDVVANNSEKWVFVECKYHNRPQNKSGVQVPLYVKARFDDLEAKWKQQYPDKQFEGWLFTNTRFSDDALAYAQCAGLRVVSWGYPKKNSLEIMVERNGLYPLTTLTTITNTQKKFLLDKNMILCSDVMANPKVLDELNIKSNRKKIVMQEIQLLCER